MMHVMLDLETLSTDPDGFICAVGAVAFDAEGITSNYYAVVRDQVGNGKIDANTVFWWLGQNSEAQNALTETVSESLPVVLADFARWMASVQAQYVWGNGAAFDNVMLAQAYRRNLLKRPWPFWGDMCYRTIKSLYGASCPPVEREGTHHNALDDARYQAQHLIGMNAAMGGGLIP